MMSFDVALKRKRVIEIWHKHDTEVKGFLEKDAAYEFFKDAFKLFCGIDTKDYQRLTSFGTQLGYKENKIKKTDVE